MIAPSPGAQLFLERLCSTILGIELFSHWLLWPRLRSTNGMYGNVNGNTSTTIRFFSAHGFSLVTHLFYQCTSASERSALPKTRFDCTKDGGQIRRRGDGQQSRHRTEAANCFARL